jgi:hypothetical protein
MEHSSGGSADDPIYGDMFGPQQQAISKDFMEIMMRLPAVLTQQVEGEGGPVDIPAEQMVEVLTNAARKLMHHVPQMAGALDIARARVTQLEKRVAELESAT